MQLTAIDCCFARAHCAGVGAVDARAFYLVASDRAVSVARIERADMQDTARSSGVYRYVDWA